MNKKILVITHPSDPHFTSVQSELGKMGIDCEILDTSKLGTDAEIATVFAAGKIDTVLVKGASKLEVSDFSRIWFRRNFEPKFNKNISSEIKRFRIDEFSRLVRSIANSSEGLVFPNLNTMAIASDKIYQLKVANDVGLRIPDTVIGNSNSVLEKSFLHNNDLLIKAYRNSGVLFYSSENDEVYGLHAMSRKISKNEIASNKARLRHTPVTIQEYIDKRIELRITVVGDRIFTAAIDSQKNDKAKIDSRKSGQLDLEHWEFKLPSEIDEKIRAFMKKLGLSFGCIDMIVTPEDEYVFLECNPNGQWKWIEDKTGMNISRAIAEELAS